MFTAQRSSKTPSSQDCGLWYSHNALAKDDNLLGWGKGGASRWWRRLFHQRQWGKLGEKRKTRDNGDKETETTNVDNKTKLQSST